MNIGIVGLGQITECHRDGYRRQGLRVVAGYDPSADARQRFAGQDPQAVVHLTLEALIDDASVQVIDLATPQWLDARLPCVEAAAAAGKPLLIQKPLAHTYDDALKLVQVIEDAGVPAMVNQNLCFVGGVQEAARAMLEDNAIGRPYLGYVVEQSCFDVAPDHWFGKGDRWWITNLTIHPLSVLHLLLGPPQSVDAVTGRDPSQPGVEAEGFVQMLLRYPVETFGGPLSVNVASSGAYYGKAWQTISPIVQGDRGVINIERGKGWHLNQRQRWLDDKPESGPQFHEAPCRWFPDAFGRVMSHFQQAIEAGRPPLCSASDNLYVMAVAEVAHRAADEGRIVPLKEIMGDRYDPAYGPGWRRGFSTWQPKPPVKADLIRSYGGL